MQRYHIAVTWENTLDCETTVTISSITVVPNSASPVSFPPLPAFDVAAGSTETQSYDSNPTDNMAQGTATVTYTYTDCAGSTVDATVPVTIPELSPCQAIGLDHPLPGDEKGKATAEDTSEETATPESDSPTSGAETSPTGTATTSGQSGSTASPTAGKTTSGGSTPVAPSPTSTTAPGN